MIEYKDRDELISEILKRSKLFIQEFDSINETDKDILLDEIDKTPFQMISYQLGWMNLILYWEHQEQKGYNVITPTSDYKWNNLGSLYKSFYAEYSTYNLKELCNIFVETVDKMIKLINSYTDTELFEQDKRKWASSTPSNWPIWKWIHINTVAPFKTFRTKIRKWKKYR